MKDYSEWISKCNHWKDIWPTYDSSISYSDETGINIYSFFDILNSQSAGDETYVTDAGTTFYIACQSLKIRRNQKFIVSGAQAEMGFALPASIGVYLADRSKNVVIITGDGSFNTNIQELATIRNYNLPIKIFVMNNFGYLSIRNTQSKFFEGRVYGTGDNNDVWFPNLKKIADAYELNFIQIKDDIELSTNIKNILTYNRPIICEIVCQRNQQVIPTVAQKIDDNGNKIQCGLDDMYPFLDEEVLKNENISNRS